MLDYLDHAQIRSLIESCTDPAVSIYLPTPRGATETKPNQIRFKNAVSKAARLIEEHFDSQRDVQGLLEPCRPLMDDSAFWASVGDGLAVFVDPSGLRMYRLPFRFDDAVRVGRQFHIRPLLPFMNRSGDFYVLALSERKVHLFRAGPYGMMPVELAGVPGSIEEAFAYQDAQEQQTWHVRNMPVYAPNSISRQPGFAGHGHGGTPDSAKQDRERFIRTVDRALNRAIADKSIPLVLASVDYNASFYRSVTAYPKVLPQYVRGNADHWDEAELWRRAWPLIEPELMNAQKQALHRYLEAGHSEFGGHTIEDVAPRAHEGRVSELIVATDGQQWGTFDPYTLTVDAHESRQPGDSDLLEFAAGQTLLHSGAVYGLRSSEMPGNLLLAATYRY